MASVHDDPSIKQALTEWLSDNADMYAEFKQAMDNTLGNPLWYSVKGLNEKELTSITDRTLSLMQSFASGEADTEALFADAIANGDTHSYCLCCYLMLDNGIETIKESFSLQEKQQEAATIAEGISSFIRQKQEEEKYATEEVGSKEMNLMRLRRWHYDHPQEYAEFVDNFNKSYNGDMTHATKGFNILIEMLSFDGIKGMISLIASLIPGTDEHKDSMMAGGNEMFHEKITKLLDENVSTDVVQDKFNKNNPHLFSALYWIVFDDGFRKTVDLFSKMMLTDDCPLWMKLMGKQIVRTLMHTSFDKAAYTKSQWKSMDKGVSQDIVSATLRETKGRRGRKENCLLLEEMIIEDYRTIILEEIDKIIAEWKQYNETDSILTYLFVALNDCQLLVDTFPYRSFHAAILEKFPQYNIKKGFDCPEALYHAIVLRNSAGNWNTSITDNQITRGEKLSKDISLRLRVLLSPDILQ